MMAGTHPRTRTDWLLLLAFCGFLLFYGLGAFGLVGADEPRYAQVAREMLERSDWVMPTLQGKPWLEKPVLYYWQAMLIYRMTGVSDWAARLPAALDAALMIAAVYFFLRHFRPGSEFDGALIAASCAGVVGFAHAAATDMPLAATFSIALLAWYAWYESGRRIYLSAFYIFLALGTLAKGPVAPTLAAVIIFFFLVCFFLVARRDWRGFLSTLKSTLWIPGIALFLLVALPWYVAVQLRNPQFFRFFILEHNLARFSQDVYHHRQPFWFYLPVFALAMMPWTMILIAAVGQRARLLWSEGAQAFRSAEDAWPLFLLLWMLVPVVFFSGSQSKLPGYILPAVPAGALLVAGYLAERRQDSRKRFSFRFATAHGVLCGLLIFASLMAASIAINHRLLWGNGTLVAAAVGVVFALGISATLLSRAGAASLTRATGLAVVVSVAAVVRFAAPAIEATQSARPIAERIAAFSSEPLPVAAYHVSRVPVYGLEFYLNRQVQPYDAGYIPTASHLLVAAQGTQTQVAQLVPGRRVSYLISFPAQRLDLYWVK